MELSLKYLPIFLKLSCINLKFEFETFFDASLASESRSNAINLLDLSMRSSISFEWPPCPNVQSINVPFG